MRPGVRRIIVVVAMSGLPVSAGFGQTSGSPRQVGRPSSAALASALGKQDSMRRPRGPASVTLSADEMASLVQSMLQPQARRALDSVGIRLGTGRLTLLGYIVTAEIGSELFGPLAAMFQPMEPVWVSGPARATAPGLISWTPDSFSVRDYMLPPSAIPVLVRRLTGGSDGTIPIAVPPTVSRIRIDPGAVTFSRR
jgi:hypothetical protein